ncbi:hypothetical protein AB205_0001390, partial [Aquarana catesbeiana]
MHSFSCSECRKCFNEKEKLLTHQKIHPGGHPYSCSECGKYFTLKSNLRTHQKRHTELTRGSIPMLVQSAIKASWSEEALQYTRKFTR